MCAVEGTLEISNFSPFILREAEKEKAIPKAHIAGWRQNQDWNLGLQRPFPVLCPLHHAPCLYTTHAQPFILLTLLSTYSQLFFFSLCLNRIGNSSRHKMTWHVSDPIRRAQLGVSFLPLVKSIYQLRILLHTRTTPI